MKSVKTVLDNIVPISSFSQGKASQNFDKAKQGPVVVLKNNTPEAVIVSVEEYKRLVEIEEDTMLLQEALQRLNRGEEELSAEQVSAQLKVTRQEIDTAVELELDDE